MTTPDSLRAAAVAMCATVEQSFLHGRARPVHDPCDVCDRARALRAAIGTARPGLDAVLALELLDRAVLTTEDETEWRDHSEGIRAAVKEGGLTLAIQRQLDFEATLDDGEFTAEDDYGPFPASLAARLTEDRS